MTSNQNKKENNQNYTDYKLLFSDPSLVKDLLTDCVKEDWVCEIDLNTLEALNTSFITDDLRERFDDKIWRARFRGEWLYLYLLLEFQSLDDYLTAEPIAFELCKSTEEIKDHIIARLHQHLKKSENESIERTFSIWLSHLLRSRLKNDNIPECHKLKEVDSMLAENITEWTEQWMAEGEVKGIGKGELIGRVRLLQQILKQPISSKEDLIAKEMSELKTLCESIEQEWQAVQN